MRRWVWIVCLALAISGCGFVGDDLFDKDDESERLAPGYTPCGDAPNQMYGVVCHPNQYCESQTFANCAEGCLSGDNCTDDQRCVKGDDDVGTCIDRDASGEDEQEASPAGYTSCGDGVSEVTCQPNQYCADDYWGDCELGCLSGDNCTDDQRCKKEAGEDVGTCVADDD